MRITDKIVIVMKNKIYMENWRHIVISGVQVQMKFDSNQIIYQSCAFSHAKEIY